jgi:hypothetical protein
MENKKVTQIELIPTKIGALKVETLQPSSEPFQWLVSTITRLSAAFGTKVEATPNSLVIHNK